MLKDFVTNTLTLIQDGVTSNALTLHIAHCFGNKAIFSQQMIKLNDLCYYNDCLRVHKKDPLLVETNFLGSVSFNCGYNYAYGTFGPKIGIKLLCSPTIGVLWPTFASKCERDG